MPTYPIAPSWPAHDEANWDGKLNTGLGVVVDRQNTHNDQHKTGGGDALLPSDIGAIATSTTAGSTQAVILTVQQTADLLARAGLLADGTIVSGEPPLTISNVTGTTTVTVTTSANHGYGSGDVVLISGVGGITGVNGTKTITRVAPTQFTLNSTTGSGSYTSGGKVQRSFGATGSSNEGVWTLLLNDNTRDGLVVRGKEGSTANLALFRDYKGAPVVGIGQIGGMTLYSGLASDAIGTAPTVTTRAATITAGGAVRAAAGDPAGGVDVVAIGNSATPPTGNPDGSHTAEGSFATSEGAIVWSRNGRLRARSAAGHEDDLFAPMERRWAQISAVGADTALAYTGTPAPTISMGNITATSDDQAEGPLVRYTTTAATNVDAGLISPFGIVQPRWSPYMVARVRTDPSAITSTRIGVGLVSADIASNMGPSTSAAYTVAAGAFVRYSSAADGSTFWRTVTGDGANATVNTASVAVAADTAYTIAIEFNSANTAVRFWINGTLVATHTTNIPSGSTALGYIARLRTLSSSARAIRVGRITWGAL
ncbi:ubiquitin-activating E1 FCCH domain-containing protein [Frankia sp. AgW1.1]|uniref:ubiquitin-activating E1 FCCH domain-containing protein n=1 Tax=Frankia sp. AgW1.1 TaxID=1836971 RepID=UPI0019322709|nr:ubiquitin-activating E1 FCCH domain-containing protein [Frankia sp. AgW1.1]MBL7487086.1 hypothetical protein [Frankia sp. AgW1.1]